MMLVNFASYKVRTISPSAVKLSWLIHANFWVFWGIYTSKVGQTDLVFGSRSGFISRSVHARLQVSVCSGYDLFHHGQYQDRQTHTQAAF